MATFSFDIVSEYDKAEMNNVFSKLNVKLVIAMILKVHQLVSMARRQKGLKLIGSNEWQIDAVLDIVRKEARRA